jgi:hypothetical protein
MPFFPRVDAIDWPGDDHPAVGRRARLDWVVLAAMLVDLALFAAFYGPGLRGTEGSPVRYWLFTAMIGLTWLGPFLGLLLRRGRGAALLCYGVAKLMLTLVLIATWWANRSAWAHELKTTHVAAWWAWHGFGAAASILTLLRAPHAARQNDAAAARH